MNTKSFFFHPDSTVGIGIKPIQRLRARGLYRRSGISPCPEDILFSLSKAYHAVSFLSRKDKYDRLYSVKLLLSVGISVASVGRVVGVVSAGFFKP